jgi:hypothetical protein
MEKKKPSKDKSGPVRESRNYSSDKPKPNLPKSNTQAPPSPKKK